MLSKIKIKDMDLQIRRESYIFYMGNSTSLNGGNVGFGVQHLCKLIMYE